MKINLLKPLLLFFLITVLSFSLRAAHIIGGEMTYVCLGDGNYEITMKVYRDCQGSGAQFDGPNNGRMSIYEGESSIEFARINMPLPEVTMVDPDNSNPCLILPPNICVEQGIYRFQLSNPDIGSINLPLSDLSYHIVYQRCCRNNSISNILQPGQTGATFYVEIKPEAQALCNDTPTFTEFPPIVICVNEPLEFDHSAIDSDGDLLVYELCSPLRGGGTDGSTTPGSASSFTGVNPNPDAPPPYSNVNFEVPTYSPTNPIGGSPQLSIDPSTGMLTGFPETEGQFVVGICVKEYRNGVLLSTVQRDFQFNITFCEPTVVAAVDGDDIVLTDPLFMFSNCNGDTVFNFQAPTSTFINEYLWEFDFDTLNALALNQQNVNVTFPGYGTYDGLLVLNPGTPCNDSATILVEIFEPPTANFSFDYDTCVAGPVSYEDLSAPTSFHALTDWNWNFGDGEISDVVSPVHSYTDPGIYNVSLQVVDENGCSNELTQVVTWQPVPPLIIIEPSSFDGCAPLDVFFNNLSTPIDDTYEIVWEFGDGGIQNAISPSYVYNTPGIYDVYIGITSPIGCFTDRFFPQLIQIDSFPIADFTFGPDRITNFKSETNFTNQSVRDVRWRWDFNGEGRSILENPTFSFPDTGLQIVELIVTTEAGCEDTVQQVVDVIPEVRYFLPNAFTPNDDTVNDEFKGVGYYRGMQEYKFAVWNRWGELVFETEDPEEGWNGRKYNGGGKMPMGIYVCTVSYVEPRGMPRELQGFITLIK